MNLDLAPDVNKILAEVEDITKKKIDFIENKKLTVYATVKIARKNMPAHLIIYGREHDAIINHLIAHECGHIIRMYKAPEEKRLIPMSNEKTKLYALKEIENDVNMLSQRAPFNKLYMPKFVDMWYEGLIKQLINLPPDVIIEKWLYDKYPNLRQYQSESINKQLKEAITGLSDEVRELTPKKIWDSSNTMNYAFLRLIGLHFGTNYIKPYHNSGFEEQGKKLAKLAEENYMDSYEGDVQVINKWAELLGLRSWFEWTDFESVPSDYLNNI